MVHHPGGTGGGAREHRAVSEVEVREVWSVQGGVASIAATEADARPREFDRGLCGGGHGVQSGMVQEGFLVPVSGMWNE